MSLVIRPISISKANSYIEQHHRHHAKKTGCKFAIACYEEREIHGVAICSNPVARNADDGLTLEISRCCTDGTKNACSILYGACARIAKDMGYRKIQTYTLVSENGSSLKASGFVLESENVGAENWQKCRCKRQIERDNRPYQISIFERKRPPEELKKRWAKYF